MQEREVRYPARPASVADAKRAMVASFALSLESPAQLLHKLPADYWDKYPDRISAVTLAQIQTAARKYLPAERMQIVAVGDPAKVADTLMKIGEVETYDADGNALELRTEIADC